MKQETRVGTVVAGYRIDSVLGRGGMSVVYLAEHLRLSRKAALKVLSSALAEDEAFRERFVQESKRAAELEHPNVIPIYDAGEVQEGDASGLLYIAMRHVEGSDLKELLARGGPLDVGRTLFLLEQVAAALDAAHARGLVHRDVKPANILVEPTDHVFLTDFGIAKQTTAPGLTRTGIFVGTIDYAAPEQIEGGPLDGRTDVYALACVLYQCLTGRRPFERELELAVIQAHLTATPPIITDVRPDLPKPLDQVITKAMAKVKDERHATCTALIDAARTAVLGRRPQPEGAAATVASAAAPARPRRALPRWAMLAALALAAATLAAVGLIMFTGGGTARESTVPIEDVIPADLSQECRYLEPRAGAEASRRCSPENADAGFKPNQWDVSTFPTTAALRAAYEAERLTSGRSRSQGSCKPSEWQGETQWTHATGEVAGRVICTYLDEVAVLIWTHEPSGDGDHANLLGIAHRVDGSTEALDQWWKVWRNQLGHTAS
jgi:predicted Ser/Thr protein kinase